MFLARRMRDEMTTSFIGPFPRSHSPAWDVKSLSFISHYYRCTTHSRRTTRCTDGHVQSPCLHYQPPTTNYQLPHSFFRLPDRVAELGGFFVILSIDGALQFF